MKGLETTIYFKHDRSLDEADRYFVVHVLINGSINASVGYIEKSFIKDDFVNNFDQIKFDTIKILKVIEYDSIDEFRR